MHSQWRIRFLAFFLALVLGTQSVAAPSCVDLYPPSGSSSSGSGSGSTAATRSAAGGGSYDYAYGDAPPVTSCVRFAPDIRAAAQRYGIDPMILAAIGMQETRLQNIVGDGGHGRGVFQIDDRWHGPWMAANNGGMTPSSNAMKAAEILSSFLRQFGDIRKAITAYNAGGGTAARGGCGTMQTWPDGQRLCYADSVFRHLQNMRSSGQGVDC